MKKIINSENLKYASGGIGYKTVIGAIAGVGALAFIYNNLKNDENENNEDNIIDQTDTCIGQQLHKKLLDNIFNENKKNNYEDE